MAEYDGEIRIKTLIENGETSSKLMQMESQFQKLAIETEKLSKKLKELASQNIPTEEYKAVQMQIEKDTASLDKLLGRMDKFLETGGNSKSTTFKRMQYEVEELTNAIKYAKGELAEMESSGTAFIDPTITEDYNKVSEKLLDVQSKQEVLNQKMKETIVNEKLIGSGAKNIEKVGKSAKKSSSLISNMAKQIKQAVVSFAIFGAVIKVSQTISEAFTEGIQNMAKYSSEFNGKMSEMASATATLKNSIGALTAPIISALTPAIVTLCTWLTNAINAMNRFIAAISGKSTWTKAKKQQVDYAASLDKTAGSAKKAAGALAAFDDLNVLQKNDSGSGSGGTSGSSGGGYEEVPLTKKDFKWAENVKEIFETILPIVVAIAAALLAWKIASFLTDLLAMSSILGTIVSWLVIIAGLALSIYSLMDMWTNGIDWENLIGYITGVTLVVAGLYALFGPMAAGIVLLVLSIAGLVTSLKDIDENGLNAKNTLLLLVSAIGIVTGTFMAFGAVAASVVAGILLISAGIADLINNGVNLKNGILIVSGIFLALVGIVGAVVAAIAALIAGLVLIIAADWENFKQTVWEPIKEWGMELWENFKQIGEGLQEIFQGVLDFLEGVFTLNWKKIWNGIKKFFIGVWDVIVGSLKASVNLLIGALNTVYNAICGVINACIEAVNKISFTVPDWVPGLGGKQFGGFNLQKIQPVNIPYLANGGITTGRTLATIGEAGREAVLPLENNTGWMDDLASKLASKMPDYSGAKTVVLAVDGKEFARINLPYLQDEEIRLGIAEG